MLTPREIVAEAWAITTKERKLWRWGFFGSTFETLRNLEFFLYQSFYLYWFTRGEVVSFWHAEIFLYESLPFWLFVATVIFTVILLIVELFAPTFATGAIIGLSAKSYYKEPVKGGFVLGLYNFFPLLEIHGMFLLSNFTVLFTIASFVIRYSNTQDMRMATLGLLAFLGLISLAFHFFSSFAEESVVIRKDGVFQAIGRSFKIIISNVQHVFFVVLLLFVISIRVFINAIVLLVIPAILTGVAILLTSFLTQTVALLITGLVGILLLVAVSYFFAYLHIFKQCVWTLAFIELSKNKELDVIEGA